MAIVTLVSAGGSPGVTTTALGMALLWPRNCLLVDADPCPNQAVLAGYLQGSVDTNGRGLPWVAEAYRRAVPLEDVVFEQSLLLPPLPWRSSRTLRASGASSEDNNPEPGMRVSHADNTSDTPAPAHAGGRARRSELGHGARFVPGYTHPGASGMFAPVWSAFATALAHVSETQGCDVIVDLGRLGADGVPRPLLQASQQVLVVTRSSLRSLARLRLQVAALREAAEHAGKARSLSLVVVGPNLPYSVSEVSAQFSLPVLGDIPYVPTEAAVLSDGRASSARGNHTRLSSAYVRLASQLREQDAAWASRLRTRDAHVNVPWLDVDEDADPFLGVEQARQAGPARQVVSV
ncbi:MAG: hypothetical protein LBM94_05635 [Propionibacteriaceae bacterium]|jgi:hypothetical protein|nr:hypothetical protein [Propionibacteriaceae bacterium]